MHSEDIFIVKIFRGVDANEELIEEEVICATEDEMRMIAALHRAEGAIVETSRFRIDPT